MRLAFNAEPTLCPEESLTLAAHVRNTYSLLVWSLNDLSTENRRDLAAVFTREVELAAVATVAVTRFVLQFDIGKVYALCFFYRRVFLVGKIRGISRAQSILIGPTHDLFRCATQLRRVWRPSGSSACFSACSSILINHERLIEKALCSVLDQDFPPEDFEVIVVDDGSTDKTPEIIRQFAPRVRLISKKSDGQASASTLEFPNAAATLSFPRRRGLVVLGQTIW